MARGRGMCGLGLGSWLSLPPPAPSTLPIYPSPTPCWRQQKVVLLLAWPISGLVDLGWGRFSAGDDFLFCFPLLFLGPQVGLLSPRVLPASWAKARV